MMIVIKNLLAEANQRIFQIKQLINYYQDRLHEVTHSAYYQDDPYRFHLIIHYQRMIINYQNHLKRTEECKVILII